MSQVLDQARHVYGVIVLTLYVDYHIILKFTLYRIQSSIRFLIVFYTKIALQLWWIVKQESPILLNIIILFMIFKNDNK